ncbi:MAG TPA: GDSL-type esterase/lipase family protein [Terriglobia bacterium]|nr:GDSL-type esterase/lipase family protein [Terriglobia bacterium]
MASAVAWCGYAKEKKLPVANVIKPNDPNLRLIGHWDKSNLADEAVTVNSGSRIICAFTGRSVRGMFGTKGITSPAEIYASIDGNAPLVYRIDANVINFTPGLLRGRKHQIEIDVKDVDEHPDRWIPPLQSALVFQGLILDRGAKTLPLPPPSTLRMEFYGDSITQGVAALSPVYSPEGSDGTKDYAFLTALAFGAEHNQIGFGRQGIIRDGNGDVPPAAESFGWNYQGSRADPAFVPEVVVVNQGTNDQQYSSERFEPAYKSYIEEIRKAYPSAWIFCLRTFGGFHEADIKSAVESVADPRIIYVDTTGWLEKSDYTDGLHPNVEGHRKAARKLVEMISARTGLKPVREMELR